MVSANLEIIRQKMSELFSLNVFVRPDGGYVAIDLDEYYDCCEADEIDPPDEGDTPSYLVYLEHEVIDFDGPLDEIAKQLAEFEEFWEVHRGENVVIPYPEFMQNKPAGGGR